MFSKAELELVPSLCQQHDVICIADEVYQWLVYDGYQHVSIGEPSRPGCPRFPLDFCGRAPEPNPEVSAGPASSDPWVWSPTGRVIWGSGLTSLKTGWHSGAASRAAMRHALSSVNSLLARGVQSGASPRAHRGPAAAAPLPLPPGSAAVLFDLEQPVFPVCGNAP